MSPLTLTATPATVNYRQFVTLSWNSGVGAGHYEVYVSIGGQPHLLATVSSLAAPSYRFPALETRDYFVRGVPDCDPSRAVDSNPVTVVVNGAPPCVVSPPALTISPARAGIGQVFTLRWNPTLGALPGHYEVYAANPTPPRLLATIQPSASLSYGTLAPAAGTYDFFVRAVPDCDFTKALDSNTASVVVARIASTPTLTLTPPGATPTRTPTAAGPTPTPSGCVTAAPLDLNISIDTTARFHMPYTLDWTPPPGFGGSYLLTIDSTDPTIGSNYTDIPVTRPHQSYFYNPPPRGASYTYRFTLRAATALSCGPARRASRSALTLTGTPPRTWRARATSLPS